jgi:hypothetical protein
LLPLDNCVFRDDPADFANYQPLLPTVTKTGKPAKTDTRAYKKWRTWQMSDHLPLWTEIKMDFTESYLQSLKSAAQPLADFTGDARPAATLHAQE